MPWAARGRSCPRAALHRSCTSTALTLSAHLRPTPGSFTLRRVTLKASAIVATTLALCSNTPLARAEVAHPLSLRIGAGAGVGNFELAGRLGLSGAYWLDDALGVGVHLGSLAQTSIAHSGVGYLAGPEVAFRAKTSTAEYWLLSLASGYAHNSVKTTLPCERDGCAVRTERDRANGTFASLEAGYIAEVKRLLGGITVRADLVGWPFGNEAKPQIAATLNFVGGFHLP
jgi:hypothetical protein